MGKGLLLSILLFTFSAMQVLTAQENKLVILNLKNGYSVKGEIVEQSAQGVKIKTIDGQIFEYKADEINNTARTKFSSPSKEIPLVVKKGEMILTLGIGFLGKLSYDNPDKLTIPPIPISFEYIINDDLFDGNGALGFGGFLGYSAAKQDFYSGTYKSSRLIIGARGYVHYALVEKLDTYAGVFLGYKSDATKYSYDNYPEDKTTEGKPTLNIFAGCRYFFNDKIAGMAELGWGMSIVTIGVAIKL